MKFKMIRNHTQRICTAILLILGIVPIFLACPQIVRAAVLIVLDGVFNDWAGQACFSDPAGDAASPTTDLVSYCFATNPNDPIAYFMVERKPSNMSVEIWLRVDVNNDGSYQSSQDRAIRIQYKPQGNHDSTTIDLFNGTNQFLKNLPNVGWGESNQDGGAKIEIGILFTDLGISVGQPLRLFFQSTQGAEPSDNTLEAQWSPADGLGLPILAGLLASAALWMSVQRRRSRT